MGNGSSTNKARRQTERDRRRFILWVISHFKELPCDVLQLIRVQYFETLWTLLLM